MSSNDVISFGKHKGETYAHVWETTPSYIKWLAKESFMDDAREIANNIVNGADGSAPIQEVPAHAADISAIDTEKLYDHQVSGVEFVEGIVGRT